MSRTTALLATLLVALLAGCSGNDGQSPAPAASTGHSPIPVGAMTSANAASPMAAASAPVAPRAHAVLKSTSSSDVAGTLAFASAGEGVHITGRITGLKPDSTHGFHIHENGNCKASDASSAGAHFNPKHQPHGHPAQSPRHAGDLPNQHADAKGVATVDVQANDLKLGGGGPTDILGRAVIVHAQPDDYASQPSGAAGARVACGVITRD